MPSAIAHKLIFRPAEGERLSWPKRIVGYQLARISVYCIYILDILKVVDKFVMFKLRGCIEKPGA